MVMIVVHGQHRGSQLFVVSGRLASRVNPSGWQGAEQQGSPVAAVVLKDQSDPSGVDAQVGVLADQHQQQPD